MTSKSGESWRSAKFYRGWTLRKIRFSNYTDNYIADYMGRGSYIRFTIAVTLRLEGKNLLKLR
jgi:hypothetical protein